MSNESENKRIDLTQFEGIGDKRHLLLIEKTPTDGYHWSLGFESDVEASMSVSSEFGREISEEADRFYNAIDKLPDLIAELKRCYEREDELVEILSILEDRHDIDMSQFDASE
jgi:acyl carrier protein